MIALVMALYLAQAPTNSPGPAPGSNTPAPTEEQKCQLECGQKMAECQMPCLPKNPNDAENPEVRKKFMACAKDCAKKGQPCLDACPKGDKGKKK